MTQSIVNARAVWHNADFFRGKSFSNIQLGVLVVHEYVGAGMAKNEGPKPTKAAAKAKEAKIPSVLEMLRADTELKDFFKLIQENGFNNKAVTLLNERLNLPK